MEFIKSMPIILQIGVMHTDLPSQNDSSSMNYCIYIIARDWP